MRRIGRLVLSAGLLDLAFYVALPAASAFGAPKETPIPGPYTPAAECGKCHTSMFKYWSESTHARAVQSDLFGLVLVRAMTISSDGAETRRQCVGCHAPTTLVTGDLELKDAISREGVTCDFCHTVSDVDLDRGWHPFVLDPGPKKRGPFAYAKPFKGHEAEYSALHRAKPLLCAGCHEFRNGNGILVLSTYTEWKQGPYAGRGVSCQDCHMALVPGTRVKEGLEQGTAGARVVNLHRLVGGTSLGQLNRGVSLKIESVTVTGSSAIVRMAVSNPGAGHSVPGGLPTKSLVLVAGLEGEGGRLSATQERVYRRELRDSRGSPLKGLAEIFVKAKSEGQDTRLRPQETRTERMSLPLNQGSRAVVARLEYRDSADDRSPARVAVVTEVRWELKSR